LQPDQEIAVKLPNAIFVFTAGAVLIMASGAIAAGDIAKGKILAKKKCGICHTMRKDGKNRLGPNLFNVLGRPAAAVKNYQYSKALASSQIV
jgi:cytochrome c